MEYKGNFNFIVLTEKEKDNLLNLLKKYGIIHFSLVN